jgi:hypothetical protein
MSDDTITWDKEVTAACEAMLDAWLWHVEDGEADSWDAFDQAAEYADACDAVIYTHKARTLWANYSEVRDHEDTADEWLWNAERKSIDDMIGLTVYCAVRTVAYEAASALSLVDVPDEDELGAQPLTHWARRAGAEAVGLEARA